MSRIPQLILILVLPENFPEYAIGGYLNAGNYPNKFNYKDKGGA